MFVETIGKLLLRDRGGLFYLFCFAGIKRSKDGKASISRDLGKTERGFEGF